MPYYKKLLTITTQVLILSTLANAQETSPDLWRPTYPNYSEPRNSVEKKPVLKAPIEKPADPKAPKYTQDHFTKPAPEIPFWEHPYIDELRKVPDQDYERSEIAITKAIIEIKRNNLSLAQNLLQTALNADPHNFLAMEYLSHIEEQKGNLQEAISWIVKAKHESPKTRFGILNFHIGRLYLLFKNDSRAEAYLRLSLEDQGHTTQTYYLLGFLYYQQGAYKKAAEFFFDARTEALKNKILDKPDHELLQAIHYYLGEIFARYGYTQYAVHSLNLAEEGDSQKLRTTAWKVHSEMNQSKTYFSLGNFLQYDSNAALLALNSDLPAQFSSETSVVDMVVLSGGYQSSPTQRWSYGIDGSTYFNYHFNTSLYPYDTLSPSGSVWTNYWNKTNWSLAAKYELRTYFNNSRNIELFQYSHGPTMNFLFFPRWHWNFEAGSEFLFNEYDNDATFGPDQRSGYTWSPFLKVFLKNPKYNIQPLLGYRFEINGATGEHFQYLAHVMLAQTMFTLTDTTRLLGLFQYMLASFPNDKRSLNRTDQNVTGRLALYQNLTENFLLTLDGTININRSPLHEFTYRRLVTTTGISYTF